jgi:hypothetical protein
VQSQRDPLPPPLMTSEPGSFARKTIVERKPQIVHEVSQAYPYPPDVQADLAAFVQEIKAEPVRPLTEDAPDRDLWNEGWARFEGHTWLDIPWYWAESYFYRRLMECVRFYQPGPWQNVDPFAPQKRGEVERALPGFLSLLAQPPAEPQAAFARMMHDALWGNRADLSNRTIMATADEGLLDPRSDRTLIDDTQRVWRYLSGRPGGRVDVIADNSGMELLLDLRLADFLLRNDLAREIRFHLKHMPFFVSDAMVRDLNHTLDRLQAAPEPGPTFAARFRKAMDAGRMTVHDDPFWSTHLFYHDFPPYLARELAASGLVLLKGDVNYRRLLEDRHWPHTAHLADIAGDFPAPFCTLRTLKGELIVDLELGQAEALAAEDPTWLINGQRGLIQFVELTFSAGRL